MTVTQTLGQRADVDGAARAVCGVAHNATLRAVPCGHPVERSYSIARLATLYGPAPGLACTTAIRLSMAACGMIYWRMDPVPAASPSRLWAR